jgi:hypothetical protein
MRAFTTIKKNHNFLTTGNRTHIDINVWSQRPRNSSHAVMRTNYESSCVCFICSQVTIVLTRLVLIHTIKYFVMLSVLLSLLHGAFSGCRWIRWSPDVKRICKCTEWVLDSRQGAVFWLGSWAWGITRTHRKNYSVSKFYIRSLGWNL